MIANFDSRHVGSDFLDDSGSLMPQHDRERARLRAVNHVQIAVTDTACRDAHQHLSRSRPLAVNLLDNKLCCRGLQNRCFHVYSFLASSLVW